VHGKHVSLAQKNEILLALNVIPNSSSSNGTMIAQNSNGGPNGTTSPSEPSSMSGLALQAGDDYVARCRAAGVPIPPPWGDSRWKVVRTLESGRIFALSPNLTTVLYSYQDPKVPGTCAALPRMNGTTIEALGIICQAQSGQACFWDNKERTVQTDSAGQQFQETISDPTKIRPELIANGDNLVENCSSCHRGTNVFILHHEALQELPASSADKPYVPVTSQADWKNKMLDIAKVPACGACHDDANRLGKLDPAYCDTVMMPSIQSERNVWSRVNLQFEKVDIHAGKKPPMPPAGEDPKDYAADIDYIKSQCRKVIEASGQTWSWN
jgi:hypothetical protein